MMAGGLHTRNMRVWTDPRDTAGGRRGSAEDMGADSRDHLVFYISAGRLTHTTTDAKQSLSGICMRWISETK